MLNVVKVNGKKKNTHTHTRSRDEQEIILVSLVCGSGARLSLHKQP